MKRIPPPKKTQASASNAPAITSNCELCDQNDTDNMVQCDNCDKWHHYQCVNVDENIADVSWSCTACIKAIAAAKPPGSHRSSQRTSASSAKRREILLQSLAEEKAMADKIAAEKLELEKRALDDQESRNREYMKEKTVVLLEDLSSDENQSDTSSKKMQRVDKWVTQAHSSVEASNDVNIVTDQVAHESTHTLVGGEPNNAPQLAEAPESIRNTAPSNHPAGVEAQFKQTPGQYVPGQYVPGQYPAVFQVPSNINDHLSNLGPPGHPLSSHRPTDHQALSSVNQQTSSNQPPVQQPSNNQPPVQQPSNIQLPVQQPSHILPPDQPPSSNQPPSQQPYSVQPPGHQPPGHQPPGNSTYTYQPSSFQPASGNLQVHYTPYGIQYLSQPPIDCLAGTSRIVPQPVSSGYNPTVPLSSHQYASRHGFSKELPTFSGKPEEWPGFISSYENTTRTCGFSNDENLIRLQRCLKGKALEAVSYRLMLPALVPDVIETLRTLFGRPEVILMMLLQKIRSEPSPKPDKLETLISYALSVQNLCCVMEASGLRDHLCNPMLVQELVDKLPAQIKLNWSLYRQSLVQVDLKTFEGWLTLISRAASSVTFDMTSTFKTEATANKRPTKSKGHLLTHTPSSDANMVSSFEKQLEELPYDQRWKELRKRNLCRTCLQKHIKQRCPSDKKCGVNGCDRRHHLLLHPLESSASKEATTASCNAHKPADSSSILFRIVPVTLFNKEKSISTFAFLDDGSSLTMLEESAAAELELEGTPESLCLKWTGEQIREEKDSRRVSLQVAGTDSSCRKYWLHDVRTVKELSLPKQNVNAKELMKKYPYLDELPVQSYEAAIPRILIGIDNWKLGLPMAVKEGKWREPVAARTRLGWVVHGYHHHREESTSLSDVRSCHHSNCENDMQLHDLVKEFFSLENFGVQASKVTPASFETKRAQSLLESTTIRIDQHYETGLLWRYETFDFPNSLPMAKRRLDCLNRKMRGDADLAANLQQQMLDYIDKGYARRLTVEETNQRHGNEWYLPIFAVKNHNKPGKVRMVWDAAASVNGVSLNSALLKGPDQLTFLPHVLFGFRQRPVAICGDIREMFHQVRIRSTDQPFQRFLWRSDMSAEPDEYVMQVMTFGATCSPSSAQYVKNVNALRFQQQYPRAVEAIVEHHYVDDLLDSVETEDEAITLAKEVREIHRQGGFEIRNWISNSERVVRALGEDPQTKMKHFGESELGAAKVLGLWWCTQEDAFTFSLELSRIESAVLKGQRRPTKREVLRILMSVYDPLGFLAAFLVYVKMLLQDIWRSTIGWDDPITDQQHEQWLRWITALPAITDVRIPRCYTREIPTNIELHIFVDASENAYAAVGYFRISTSIGVECALVAAKTKVAPIQPMSIPRLELQAAMLGARLANSIKQGHSINISRQIFWSDSSTVLSWLRSDPKKFRQFVSFRVGEILETTELENWRWVPTKLNVADEATKWQRTPELSPDSRWFTGPPFLKLPEENWPEKQICAKTPVELELRTHAVHVTVEPPYIVDVNRQNQWHKLLRTQARLLRVATTIRARARKTQPPTGPLTDEEFKRAENNLFRRAQFDYLEPQILKLRVEPLKKGDSLHRYDPKIDEHDIVRMQGRIDEATGVDEDVKRPVILPRQHKITQLIVSDYHERYHHINHETVINELRQRFVIPRLRQMTRSIRAACQKCKLRNARPNVPQMAGLPKARLAAFTRPFTYVGVDCFGPFTVVLGRRVEKRWGMLFTCLTVRALHIEVAYTLSTDSCVMCLTNFMARRGTPLELYSDNGTNFHGADNAFKAILKEMQDRSRVTTIKWKFNPPASPHMGGSWERLIGSVKKVLYQIMPEHHHLNDESLKALLTEVEGIVNSRPLTHVSLEHEDDEALTPNHFLLGSSSGTKPLGEFSDSSRCNRKSWAMIQHLSDKFWQRWMKEYLPTLTRRSKWHLNTKNIEIGDLVIVVDENLPRGQWIKGRIIKTTPGKDGIVRRATVQTNKGILERPSVKLAILDVSGTKDKPTNTAHLPGGRMSPIRSP